MTTLPIPLARCPRRFADMTRDGDHTRFCGQCAKSVHDLSAMSRAEAARLLAGGDDLCVRYLHVEGRVVHRGKRALAVLAVAIAPLLTEACGGAPARYDYHPVPAADDDGREPSAGDASEDRSR